MLKKIVLLLIILVMLSCSNKDKDKNVSNSKVKKITKVEKIEKDKKIKKDEVKLPKDLERLQKYIKLGSEIQKKKNVIYSEVDLIAKDLRKTIKPFFIKKSMPYDIQMNVHLTGNIVTLLKKENKRLFNITLKYHSEITETIKKRYNITYLEYPARKYQESLINILVGNFEVMITATDKSVRTKEKIEEVAKNIDYKTIENFLKDEKNKKEIELLTKLEEKSKELHKIVAASDNNTAVISLKPFIKKLKEKYKDYSFRISYTGNYTISIRKDKKQQAWIFISYIDKSKTLKGYDKEILGFKSKRIKDLSLKALVNNLNIGVTANKTGELFGDEKIEDIFKNIDLNSLKLIN